METILDENIDFKRLKRINEDVASQSRVYTEKRNRENFYKFFNEVTQEKLEIKRKKLELFSGLDLNFLNVPNFIIEDKYNIPRGFKSDYIANISIIELRRYLELEKIIYILIKISRDIQQLHLAYGNPVFGDLHFKNIGLDSEFNHYFFDIDSYGVENYLADNLPDALYTYCDFLGYDISKTQNADRICFMLSLFSLIFGKNILSIGEYEYDVFSEKYSFLKDLKEIYLLLRRKQSSFPHVPYFHEIINENLERTREPKF